MNEARGSAHGAGSGLIGQEEPGGGLSDIVLRDDSLVGAVEHSAFLASYLAKADSS
jgi:hypothetical protein